MKEEFIIKKKLEYSIIPYLNCGSGLKRSRNFILYHVYDYTKEIFTLLAGYGVTFTFLKLNIENNDTLKQTAEIVKDLPNSGLSYIGIGLGVCTGILRFAYGREGIAQRVIGQKKLMKNLALLRTQVNQALADAGTGSPLNSLIAIQKELITVVNNNIQEGIYEFENCMTPENLEKSKAETNRLLQQFNVTIEDSEEVAEETPDQIV